MKPIFSIITVCYNSEKTIERTVRSILDQKFVDYEYIIQDGSSKDRTLDIVNSYKAKFGERLTIYSEKDNGIYDAMNKGIAHANGQYIWLVNSDDYITPNALRDLYEICKGIKFKQCVLSGRLNLVDADTLRIKNTSTASSNQIFENSCKRLKMGICHPATIVHRAVYDLLGVYDARYFISADVDFCIRCYRNNVDVLFIDKVVTNMSDGGISNQYPIRKNMHDYRLRTEKFCDSYLQRIAYTTLYFFKLLVLNIFHRFALRS